MEFSIAVIDNNKQSHNKFIARKYIKDKTGSGTWMVVLFFAMAVIVKSITVGCVE
jgi:hypothetical protein